MYPISNALCSLLSALCIVYIFIILCIQEWNLSLYSLFSAYWRCVESICVNGWILLIFVHMAFSKMLNCRKSIFYAKYACLNSFSHVYIAMNYYCISCVALIFKPNLSSSVFIGHLPNVYIISLGNECVCVCARV